MINAARRLARRGDVAELMGTISNAPQPQHESHAAFRAECEALMRQLAESDEFAPSPAVQKVLATVRAEIDFMARDRAMDGDIARICALVERGALRP
jgi:histidine ammonia-lyase